MHQTRLKWQASHSLNEINIPAFQANTLILKYPGETSGELVELRELQDLARTTPQGAPGINEL